MWPSRRRSTLGRFQPQVGSCFCTAATRRSNWSLDGWAKNQLGERRLGELFLGRQMIGRQTRTVRRQQIGRLGDIFRRLGDICERGETQNSYDRCVPTWLEMKPCVQHWEIRAENWGLGWENFLTLTADPLGNQSPPKHAIWHKKTVSTLLKMWSLKADKKSYLKN